MVLNLIKKRKSSNERKEQILDEAFKLFGNGNYSSIVMDHIAKACNIARTTLYEYFPNKEEILIALIERVSFEAREIQTRGNSYRENLMFLAEDLIETIQNNKTIYRILFQATPVMSEKLSTRVLLWRKQNFEQVIKIAQLAKDSGDIRTEITVDDISFGFQAFVGQRTGELIMTDQDVDPKEEAKRLIDMLWFGIGKHG